jgi:hypothetical protein
VYTYWKLSDDSSLDTKISQFWVPVSGFVPIQDNFEVHYSFAGASTKLSADEDETISGVNNVRIQFSRAFMDDHYLTGIGVSLPTGKRELEVPGQRDVIDLLSQSFLDFPMREYGKGFGFNVVLGTAHELGEVAVGLGAVYEFNGKYRPYEDFDEYDPGDAFNVNGGIEHETDRARWTANAIFTTYLADKVGGNKLFKQSDQLGLDAGAEYRGENYRLAARIGYVIRGRNSYYDGETEDVVQRLKLYGNEFNISLRSAHRINPLWYVRPMVHFTYIAGDEMELGSSNAIGLGSSIGRQVGENLNVELGATYITGGADDGNIDLTGIQIVGKLGATF